MIGGAQADGTTEANAASTVAPFNTNAPAEGVAIVQHVGDVISVDNTFRDEEGKTVRIGDYFGKRPVVLMLGYYECPMLCNQVLQGLLRTLKALEFQPGQEYEVVVVSIAPHETPLHALRKREAFLANLATSGREITGGVHFLSSDEANVRKLADEVGFQYRYEEKTKQYAHAAGVMVLTPGAKLSRYFYGIDYPTRDMRFAIMDAANEKLGSVVDQVLLLCFHYDPTTGRYGLAIMRLVRTAGVLTVCGLAIFVTTMLRRERKRLA
ncbi:MAG: SCO family protein [Pirellulales bacterium]